MALAGDQHLQVKKLRLGPYGTNAYVLIAPRSRECVLIDTPAEADKILDEVKGCTVRRILITHTHRDHLGAFEQVRASLKAPVAVHPAEAANLPSKPDVLLSDGDTILFGGLSARVLHTPGHTAGSVCLLLPGHLFAGDTIFAAGPGKTGSPAALQQIIRSITAQVFVLPDETVIHPGHGDDTVVGKERREYEVFAGRGHDPRLCGDVVWLVS